jgi:hypothetical protein
MSLQGVDFSRKGRKNEPRRSAPYVPGKRHERYWTEPELEVLRQHFVSKGMNFCMERLPGRSKSGAYVAAHKLGLRRIGLDAVRGSWRDRFPEIDEALKKAWPAMADARGTLKALAIELGVPRDVLTRRAVALGLAIPRIKEPAWSTAENELMRKVPLHNPDRAAEIFAAHGFRRTPTSIMVRAKRLNLSRRYKEKLNAMAVARILGVDNKTVSTWIVKGWLKTERRGTVRTSQQGGDWHLISRAEFKQWILDNLERIDIRKVEKFAFVDVLVNGDAKVEASP